MEIIKPQAELLSITSDATRLIELAGRICYKSEDRIGLESDIRLINLLMERQHLAVLEHASATIKFVTDRGVTHEMVRHRLAAYCQESTRYVRYADPVKNPATEDDVVSLYSSGFSMKRISELSNGQLTEWDVRSVLIDNEVEIRGHNNSGPVNHSFLNEIDTPEKAWFLGLFAADGSMRGREVPSLSITQKNGWFVQQFISDFIKPTVKPYKDRSCDTYVITSSEMWQDLYDKGMRPRKSFNWEEEDINSLWDSIPVNLIPDFLRGLLDGDGNIRFFRQDNPGKTNSVNMGWAGNKNLVEKISIWLDKTLDYRAKVSAVSGDNLYRVTVSKPSVAHDLCDLMYANFRWPYGHPAKTSRVFKEMGWKQRFGNCGHGKMQIIVPPFKDYASSWAWGKSIIESEKAYGDMILQGETPQIARSVLPNSLKTEIIMTCNFREWLHVFALRTSDKAHPQIRQVMDQAKTIMARECPIIFDRES